MQLPPDFPHRPVHKPGWSDALQVPRHIIRIDIEDPGKAGTHGWQVRYVKPWRFFNDKMRPPAASLKEAVHYLAEVYTGPRLKTIRKKKGKRKTKLEPGLRLVKRVRKGRTVQEIWVEAMPPSKEFSPVRIYAGTENTATSERIEFAKMEARKAREHMLTAHLKKRRF